MVGGGVEHRERLDGRRGGERGGSVSYDGWLGAECGPWEWVAGGFCGGSR